MRRMVKDPSLRISTTHGAASLWNCSLKKNMVTLLLKLSKAIVKDLVRTSHESTEIFEDIFGTNVLNSKEYFLEKKKKKTKK